MDDPASGGTDGPVDDDDHETVGSDEAVDADDAVDAEKAVNADEAVDADEAGDDELEDDEVIGSDETIDVDVSGTDPSDELVDAADPFAGGEAVSFDLAFVRDALRSAGDEEAALRRVRFLARLLDDAVAVPGTSYRVGLDPILGILPGAGDSVTAALSLYPVVEAVRLGASKEIVAKMLALVAVDLTVGSIPVLGTVFDAFWKANEWNVRTIERLVEES